MSLKKENSFGPFFLSLFLLCFSIAACGGIVSAPNEKLTIESTFPDSGAVEVDKGIQSISVTFNKEMDPAFLNASNFFLELNGTKVPGTVSLSGPSATFAPASSLTALATYSATVTSAARDLSGDSIGQDFSWKFTLSNVTDTTLPFVIATNPVNGASNVPVNTSSISVTFSKAIKLGTVKPNLTLSLNHGTLVQITVSPDAKTFTLVPVDTLNNPKALDFKRSYDLEVLGGPNGIQDTSGNEMDLSNNPNPDAINKPDTYISVFKTKADTGGDF